MELCISIQNPVGPLSRSILFYGHDLGQCSSAHYCAKRTLNHPASAVLIVCCHFVCLLVRLICELSKGCLRGQANPMPPQQISRSKSGIRTHTWENNHMSCMHKPTQIVSTTIEHTYLKTKQYTLYVKWFWHLSCIHLRLGDCHMGNIRILSLPEPPAARGRLYIFKICNSINPNYNPTC